VQSSNGYFDNKPMYGVAIFGLTCIRFTTVPDQHLNKLDGNTRTLSHEHLITATSKRKPMWSKKPAGISGGLTCKNHILNQNPISMASHPALE
jgi:hypothetical protein